MTLAQHLTRIIDFFYFPFLRRWFPLQTFRYAACGSANMVFDLALYFVLYHLYIDFFGQQYVRIGNLLDITPYIATWLVVFPITFMTGFWLNRNISFRSSPLRGRVQLFRYMLSVSGAILLNYLLLKFFVEVAGFYPTPSNALAKVTSIIYSYLMQKHFSFRGCTDQ